MDRAEYIVPLVLARRRLRQAMREYVAAKAAYAAAVARRN